MSNTAVSVARQASLLMIASTLQKAIAFVAFTLAARWLGAEQIGLYFFALSLSSLAGAWTDLGLTPVVIRAFAASEERGWSIVRRAMSAKLVLIPGAVLAALLYGWANGMHQGSLLGYVAIALLVMASDSVSLLGYGILRGRQRLEKESLGMVIGQLISSAGLVSLVWLGGGVAGALAALACGSLWHVGWSVYWVRRLGIPAQTLVSPWGELFEQALPFALSGLFVRVYSSVDAIFLKRFYGENAVGQYAVAYKLTYALQFLPMAFVAALYPALSAAHARDDERALVHTALGSFRFMALIGFPLAAALSAFAPRLVPFLYGEAFAPAAAILAVLAWALPLIFLDFPIGSYLNATHRARQKTTAMGVAMGVNVVLNALLTPRFGGMGAAWAAVGCFIALLGVGIGYEVRVFFSATARRIMMRGLLVALVLWSVIRFGLGAAPLLFACGIAPLAALVLVWVVGLLETHDIQRAKAWIQQRV